MPWDIPNALHQELGGDAGPWNRHLKAAWRASITKTSDVSLPKAPSTANIDSSDGHARVIAFWGPLLPLVIYGLGWSRPDVGLLRWREQGFPQKDLILRTVLRWWGEDGISDFLAWAQVTGGFGSIAYWLGDAAGIPQRHSDFPYWPGNDDLPARRDTPDWKAVWSGVGDPHHLLHHARSGIDDAETNDAHRLDGYTTSALMLDRYAGWYRHLVEQFPAEKQPVDVVIKPIGWIGTFHRSGDTGIWHRTDEATHQMAVWT